MRVLFATLVLAMGSMALMPLNPMRTGLNAKPVGIAMRIGHDRLFGRSCGRFGLSSLRSPVMLRYLYHPNKRLVSLVCWVEMSITFHGALCYTYTYLLMSLGSFIRAVEFKVHFTARGGLWGLLNIELVY